MKTIVSVFLYVIICSIQIYAVSAEEINLNAKAAVIMDAESGKILYEKSKDQKMPNASTTKILTCLYILKHCDLDQMAEVSKNAAMQPKVRLGVREGEKYKVKDLLYGLMLESYNDCAVVLAEHAEGSVEKFEKRMNQMAENLGALNRQHRIWQRSWHDVLRISNFLKSRRQNNIHLQMAAEREDLSAIITMPCYPACKE